jgi:tetratricopeptide (TPR) repeat protein
MTGPTQPTPEPPQGLTVEQAVAVAHAHWNAGQAEQAERLCYQVLALWPGHADACHLLGLIAHAYGNLPVAIDYLRKACQAPRAPAAYFSNLAEMCRQKGLLAEAEEAARRSVEIDNALVAGWNNLGIVLQEAGKLEESRSCLIRVTAMQPGNADGFNNLGNTLKRMGLLREALDCYRKATELNPDYAEAHSNLAFLLIDVGRFDEALASARRAIEINPRFADAYINAAAAEHACNRTAQAVQRIDALLSFAPLHAGALSVRAKLLRDMDMPTEALEDARRAASIAPADGEIQNCLGECLKALGRYDEAAAAFAKAAAAPGFAPERALINQAVILMERGDTAAAEAAFADLVQRFPRSAPVWFNRADLVTAGPGDPSFAAMEALLGPGGLQSDQDRLVLHFALGKAWLDVGDAERAFAYYKEGNRLKRATFAYDADATDRWLAGIAAAFPAERFRSSAVAEDVAEDVAGADLPVFVVGMPRSGTSLVEQVLASHPLVLGAGELGVLPREVDRLGPYPAAASGLSQAALADLGRAYLDQVRPMAGVRQRVVDKMPSNFLYAGLIALALPKARIIHVQRDPLDTCLSCYTKLFMREQQFSYDLAELGRFYRGYQRLMEHWRAVLPADRFIEVRYEDIVDDLEGQSRRLVDFCGLSWHPACLEFHRTPRIIRTASLNQVRRPLFRSSVGRGARHAAYLGPLLDALGATAASAQGEDGASSGQQTQ